MCPHCGSQDVWCYDHDANVPMSCRVWAWNCDDCGYSFGLIKEVKDEARRHEIETQATLMMAGLW